MHHAKYKGEAHHVKGVCVCVGGGGGGGLYVFQLETDFRKKIYTCTCTYVYVPLERASQEEHSDANFSFVAPSSEEL